MSGVLSLVVGAGVKRAQAVELLAVARDDDHRHVGVDRGGGRFERADRAQQREALVLGRSLANRMRSRASVSSSIF